MTVEFEIDGQKFVALNGGPQFKFTEAVSFAVDCKTQEEVDMLGKNSLRAEKRACVAGLRTSMASHGRFTPTVLGEMLADKDPKKAGRVMTAMLKMKKIDIATLKKAYEQR